MTRIEITETICGDILSDEATEAAARLIGEYYRSLLIEEYERALQGCECDIRVDMSIGGLHDTTSVFVDEDEADESTMQCIEDCGHRAYGRLIQAYTDATVPGVIWLDETGEWVAADGDRLTGDSALAYAYEHEGRLNKYADPTEEARKNIDFDEAEEIADEDPSLIWCETTL